MSADMDPNASSMAARCARRSRRRTAHGDSETIIFPARTDSEQAGTKTIRLTKGELVVTAFITAGASSRRPAHDFVLDGGGKRIFNIGRNGQVTLNGMTPAQRQQWHYRTALRSASAMIGVITRRRRPH